MDEELEGMDVLLEDEPSDVTEDDAGGAVVVLEDEESDSIRDQTDEHFENLVESFPKSKMATLVSQLLDKIEIDQRSREKRDELYAEGLRRTGLGDDAPGGATFSGATRVVHPMMIEACVDFQARAMKELFPANGPAKSKVVNKKDKTVLERAQRRSDFMNWQMTQKSPEFRSELEQLLTQLPLGGGQYLKLVWHPKKRRAIPEFVPIDDMFLPFAASNFYTAERKTHRQYVTEQEFEQRVASGMYADVLLSYAAAPEESAAQKANDKIEGRTADAYNEDGLRVIYEIAVDLQLDDDDELAPYIFTIDDTSRAPLALYRNWMPDDEQQEELYWIVEFPFVPWRGAYPIGLTHMIGGLSGAATGALRALLDSAHVQNIPTLAKLKGGMPGQTMNLQPTEVVEIEGGALADDIRKLLMPIPFNPPSPTLFSLLGFLVDAGRGVVQTSFEKLSDNNANAPVGTTLALIEQGMVVFSSIHSRLHNSIAMMLRILQRINRSYLTEEDIEASGIEGLTLADFDEDDDAIVPVSDPAIFSETQRFAQIQAVMQRADVKPQLYDARLVEELFLQQLKFSEDVLVKKETPENMDPASENVAMTMGAPVTVLPQQEHLEHLMVHASFIMSPVFGSNSVIQRTLFPPMIQHLRDHLLQFYLTEAQRAVSMSVEQQLLTEDDAQAQAELIRLTQVEVEKVVAQYGQLLSQIEQFVASQQPQGGMPPDSSLAVAQINAQQRAASDAQKTQLAGAKMQQEAQSKAVDQQLKSADLQFKAQSKEADLALQQQEAEAAERRHQEQLLADAATEQLRQSSEDARMAEELAARERMNSQDNETAMVLAAAEIESGERVAVSTGTGINPNPGS